jgi:dihydrofolate reductase
MCVIVAVEKNGGIGYKNKIPWPRIRSDIKQMYNIINTTTSTDKQNAVILGRLTWESLPKRARPIPNAYNVVLSSRPSSEFTDADLVCNDLTSAVAKLSLLTDRIERVIILGGSRVYKDSMASPLCDTIYYTDVMADYDSDAFWPGIDETLYKLIDDDRSAQGILEENGVKYRFLTYKRII